MCRECLLLFVLGRRNTVRDREWRTERRQSYPSFNQTERGYPMKRTFSSPLSALAYCAGSLLLGR